MTNRRYPNLMNFNLAVLPNGHYTSIRCSGRSIERHSRGVSRLIKIKGRALLMLLAVLLGGSFAAAGLPAIALSEVERAAAGWAKEIVSNGRGGGPWTAPDAWRGNAVPGPADAVIIQTNDTIIFDGNYPDQATCRQLRIDSGARLNFKEEAAQHILSVAGPIEVRGKIHIDLSRFPRGLAEIRMVAESEAERIIHVFSNGAFMAIGASGLADGRYNVIVSTGPPRPGMPRRTGQVKSDPESWVNFLYVGLAHSAEYHSNGRGGGNWSDPGTWHGGIVPAGADFVVIAADDTVIFDGNSSAQPACRSILIDPKGMLMFQADEREHVLSVDGPIESYGTIHMDGSKAPLGAMELRLMAEADEERTIRMRPNSALLLYGAEGAGGRKNVALSSVERHREALIVVEGKTQVDIRQTAWRDVVMQVSDLDNTGLKPNERLNIAANDFTGGSRLNLSNCDTPAVRNNTFGYGEAPQHTAAFPALAVRACKLAQIQNNSFIGRYATAIQVQQDVDSSLSGNVISNAARGIYWSGQNAMLRGNTIAGCQLGIVLESVTGVVESATVRGSDLALDLQHAQVQFTDVRVENMPTNAMALELNGSEATLLNCNIEPPQIKVAGEAPATASWVQTMNYLVVQVKGQRPQQTLVEVRTAAASGGPPKGGAADLNVRNAPARVNAEGFTPLPRSLRALVVRSWAYARDGKKKDAPFYDLVISAPDEKGGAFKALKSMVIEPKAAWYRPEPNRLTATVEVILP